MLALYKKYMEMKKYQSYLLKVWSILFVLVDI